MTIKLLLAPLLGGVIGYITNDIAIKMLFRPRKAVYLGRFRLPFTPGLIPRQKDRIAQAIGGVVGAQLLNADTVGEALLSEESLDILRRKLTEAAEAFGAKEETVEEWAGGFAGPKRFGEAADALEEALAEKITQELSEADIGAGVVAYCSARLREKFRGAAFLGRDFAGQIEASLASAINEMAGKAAPDIVRGQIRRISGQIRGSRICDLYEKYQDKVPAFVEQAAALYERALRDNLERILRAVDIGGIVSKKVASLDEEALENLIFGIMKRELRAIVYLGALLGALMGFINLLL